MSLNSFSFHSIEISHFLTYRFDLVFVFVVVFFLWILKVFESIESTKRSEQR